MNQLRVLNCGVLLERNLEKEEISVNKISKETFMKYLNINGS